MLVYEPLRWAKALRPEWIACEQVKEVLPIWRQTADELRTMGYSTWCGVLDAVSYGSPQHRRRAILMASRVREVQPPPPTHGRDAGATLWGNRLESWRTMADALGWGLTKRPSSAVVCAKGGGGQKRRYVRSVDRPAMTVTGESWSQWKFERQFRDSIPVTIAELGVLQDFPVTLIGENMTRDELCAAVLAAGLVIAEPATGRAFGTRGPGGHPLANPVEVGACDGGRGYRVATLHFKGAKKQVRRARLIWIAVHGVPAEGMTIDHHNGDHGDDRIANLRLMTASENSKAAWHEQGLQRPHRKVSIEQVELMCAEYRETRQVHRVLAEKYGLSRPRVSEILREQHHPWEAAGTREAQARAVGNALPINFGRCILAALTGQAREAVA